MLELRNRALATTVLTSIVASPFAFTPATAADLYPKFPVVMSQTYQPAVDGVNWKASGIGGSMAREAIYAGLASLSLPLGGQYGLQLDGVGGSYASRGIAAGGAHLFWRDPSRGLVGIYGAGTYWDRAGGLSVGNVAGEFEVYWGRWTVQAIAGVEFGNSKTETIGNLIETYDVRTRFFDKVNLAYYLTDNWKAFIGHRYLGGKNALALGTEVAFRLNGPVMASMFVEGRIGEANFDGVWGGLRFYVGQKDKTLIQRHRQDDPIEWTPETLFSITNSQTTTPVIPKNNPPPCPEFPYCSPT